MPSELSQTPLEPPPGGKGSYTTVELARRLGVSLQTVQRWADSGKLRSWKTPGGHRRIDPDSVESFVQTLRNADGRAPDTKMRDLTVLLVEDHPVELELLRTEVGSALPQARLLCARDGFEALMLAGQTQPDIVVTDIMMPNMDGFQMVSHLLRGAGLRAPVVLVVTGLSSTELANRGGIPKSVRVLQKPYEPPHLMELLRQAAKNRCIAMGTGNW